MTAGNAGIVQREGGRSWPDLDVFPFGLLTLPGEESSFLVPLQENVQMLENHSQDVHDAQCVLRVRYGFLCRWQGDCG